MPTRILPLLLISLMLLACGRSTPTSYYLLESSPGIEEAVGQPDASLRVAQVSVPAYLDRTGIVSRVNGENRLLIAEFHAWAEPLGQGVRRVLQEALTVPMLRQGIDVLPSEDDRSGDFVLLVDIQRFDGSLGDTMDNTAVLEARWTLQRNDGTVLGRGIHADKESISVPASRQNINQSYDLLVGAQSRLLQDMATALLQQLPPLMRK
ncbi:MAG: PqiC family protein [Desulfovibrionaceae bacterium]|nr:PqiC family protein [Desulfovibrionaceae bacterium]